MPDLRVLPTSEAVAQAGAALVAEVSGQRVREAGRFTIALSGGSTPRRLYQLLTSDPHAEGIAWEGWHVFWGDERCVPPDHEDSNYRMAREALLDKVAIPRAQVHRIRGEDPPQDAADAYERELREAFGQARPNFDLVLLGMGDDGHTASLFPGTGALEERERPVAPTSSPGPGTPRVTFTLPLINAARRVVFVVTGAAKAPVVRRVLAPSPGDPTLPAALVQPHAGQVTWLLSEDAATLLPAALLHPPS